MFRGSSPISSKNMTPPLTDSSRPCLTFSAPVKASWAWPKSSLSMSSAENAPQFTARNRLSARGESSWMMRATSSLPVPVSPCTRTLQSNCETWAMVSLRAWMVGSWPMKRVMPLSDSMRRLSSAISLRRPRFSSALSTRARISATSKGLPM